MRAIENTANTLPSAACAYALGLVMFVWLGMWVPVAAAQDQHNIVLIVADDIGYSDFGAYGGEIQTPHIDALAAQGGRFTNFHVASSCAPTRAMLMTGVDNHLAGIGSMRELMPLSHRGKPGYDGVLNDRVQTIASLLQAGGYRTSVAGKWHLGDERNNLPPARGFDYSVIQADSGSDNFEMRPYLPMQMEALWYENGERMSSLPEDFYSSRYFVDKTIEHLESTRAQHRPFFAYVAFQANHTPIQAPASFIDQYRGHYLEGWAKVRKARIHKLRDTGLIDEQATLAPGVSQQDWDALTQDQQYFEARRMQAYAGMATAMDHEIGRLITYLHETGEYENTVFLLLSDNGAVANEPYENAFGRRWLEKHYHREVETLGEKGSWVSAGRRWGGVANTPFAGQKFSAGEGGVRVPLIIAGLPLITPGALSHEFSHITDIAPTLLQVAGLQPPDVKDGLQVMSGKSLLSTFKPGSSPIYAASEAIGYEFSGNSALYRGDFKLVMNQPPVGDRQWRLFNIQDDPGETTDLSKRLPGIYKDMQKGYAAYAERVGVLPIPENYSLVRQVVINTVIFKYLPRYWPYFLGLLVLLAVILFLVRLRRLRLVNPGSDSY